MRPTIMLPERSGKRVDSHSSVCLLPTVEHAAADLGAEVIDSDAGLAGRIIILPKGTLFLMR